MSGISGKTRGPIVSAADKLRSSKETLRTSKKARSAVAAAAGTVVLTGALVGVGINAHAADVHKQQVIAAAEAAQVAQAKASASASAEAAAQQAAAQKAAAKAAADAAAAKAAADQAAAQKAAADKAAADKAAADAAAAKALAERQAAASAANRDQQRQPITPTTSAPKSDPTTQSYAPVTPGSARAIAQGIVPAGQFGCFDWIIQRESGWNIHATNPSSGAYGLPQALPGSKMASAGPDWQNDAATQIRWALSYMDSRYGSPCGAESFWQSHGWY